jgi:GNAT superfamily N-acetyltransferase
MGHVRRHGERARLGMLYVDGRRRRLGIGKALVAAQKAWAHAVGATELVCHIPEVSAGQQLAEQLGWERTREVTSSKHGSWSTSGPSSGPPPSDSRYGRARMSNRKAHSARFGPVVTAPPAASRLRLCIGVGVQ